MATTKYELRFDHVIEKKWNKLDNSVKMRFKEKLGKERLLNPRVPKDALRDQPDCFKIKLTIPQYRLVYHVDDTSHTVTIIALATREDVYEELRSRLS